MKKRILENMILIWIVCFVMLSIVAKGMGIFEFKKKQFDISRFIDHTDSSQIDQQKWSFDAQSGREYMLFNFSKEHIDEAIYGVELEIDYSVDMGSVEAYFNESADNLSDEEWQAVTIEHKHDRLTMRFTKGHGCLVLCADRPADIISFSVITQCGMARIYAAMGALALCISMLFAVLKRDQQSKTPYLAKIITVVKSRDVIITLAVIVIEGFVICMIEALCYLYIRGVNLNPCRAFMLGCMAAFITVVIRHKEVVVEKFHVFYFCLMFVTGSIYILGCAPYSLDLSWDDQIHYARVNYVARGFHSYETEAGYQLKGHYFDRGTLEDNFKEEKRAELAEYINLLDKNKEYAGFRYVESYYTLTTMVSYVPAAIGLIIGRGLGMPTMMTLLMGRWANLLCYAMILSNAVWLLRKRGYIIAAFIGLIPVALFLASNYSYDWWVTSLSILGYALFERSQGNDGIGYVSMFKIVIVMFLAILPKAVYLTMVIPMIAIFTAKEKKNRKGLVAVMAIVLVLAASFLGPLISSGGAAYSDTRGGADVNSAGQIRFILTQPLQYIMILARFLWRYINPDHCVEAFGYYILFGTGKFYSVVLILLVIGTIVDNIGYKEGETGIINVIRVWSVVGILATLALISTAMYVSYTAVGSKDIIGVQSRYSFPLFFLLLFYVCRINIEIPQRIKNNVAVYGSMLMAAIFCFNIYVQCICFY